MNNKGYALIELMSVLGIVSILATISIISLKADKLKGATKMIYYDLHYARMAAIKERTNFRVTFYNTNGHTYEIHHDVNSNDNKDDGESVISKDIHTLFRGISFISSIAESTTTATFNSVGMTNLDPGDEVSIIITDGSDTKNVIFSREGRVRINGASN
ncbi:MAG: GspH/FimT family pseudopilin [bacterium]